MKKEIYRIAGKVVSKAQFTKHLNSGYVINVPMSEAKHTPTPWAKESSLFRSPVTIGIYGNNLKKTIAKWECSTKQDAEQMHADAAHIVKCVNSHEYVLDTLKMIHDRMYEAQSLEEKAALYNYVKAAIAKAEGGK